jgi:Acetyltransferase (GNAT) domain
MEEAPRPDGHLMLFNHPEYLARRPDDAGEVMRVDHVEDGRLRGSFTGVRIGDCFVSGHSAPMGGPDLVRDDEPAERVEALVEATLTELRRAGVRWARVRARTGAWCPADRKAAFALLRAGFTPEVVHLNHHVDLTGLADADAYLAALDPKARNMVRKAQAFDLRFADATTDEEWRSAWAVLEANKAAKGRRMSIGLDYARDLAGAFPGRIRLSALWAECGAPVAAALTYLVRDGVELVANWGDGCHSLPRSPMNLLARELVARALGEETRLLDLGISSDGDGSPNHGLAFFKERVLGRPEVRLDLALELVP